MIECIGRCRTPYLNAQVFRGRLQLLPPTSHQARKGSAALPGSSSATDRRIYLAEFLHGPNIAATAIRGSSYSVPLAIGSSGVS